MALQDGNGVTLGGFSGFGSFMQDKSVQTLVAESEGEYAPPPLPVSSDPAEHGFLVSLWWPTSCVHGCDLSHDHGHIGGGQQAAYCACPNTAIEARHKQLQLATAWPWHTTLIRACAFAAISSKWSVLHCLSRIQISARNRTSPRRPSLARGNEPIFCLATSTSLSTTVLSGRWPDQCSKPRRRGGATLRLVLFCLVHPLRGRAESLRCDLVCSFAAGSVAAGPHRDIARARVARGCRP